MLFDNRAVERALVGWLVKCVMQIVRDITVTECIPFLNAAVGDEGNNEANDDQTTAHKNDNYYNFLFIAQFIVRRIMGSIIVRISCRDK